MLFGINGMMSPPPKDLRMVPRRQPTSTVSKPEDANDGEDQDDPGQLELVSDLNDDYVVVSEDERQSTVSKPEDANDGEDQDDPGQLELVSDLNDDYVVVSEDERQSNYAESQQVKEATKNQNDNRDGTKGESSGSCVSKSSCKWSL